MAGIQSDLSDRVGDQAEVGGSGPRRSTEERQGMSTVTVVNHIAAPVEEVFGVFTDLEHGAERVSNIQKIEVLTVGGFKLGTRWLETRETLGQSDRPR